MTKLLVLREYLKHFYSKNEVFIRPLWKFLLAFVTLLAINGRLGYMERIDNIMIVLIAALMCSFLPTGCIVMFAALFILLHLYTLSMECAIVMLMLMLVMFLLYFRFANKDTIVLLLTPLAFVCKVPYVMPIAMGLAATPASVVSVGCGTVIYFFLAFINDSASTIGVMEDDIMTRFRFLIDGLINNKAMIVTVAAFTITIIIVYLIRRMSVDYSWTIAMVAGTLVNVVMLLVGDLMYDTNVSILGLLLGSAAALIIAKIMEFFVFSVDYSRTERVQFEDDEYYYYVKAIPKLSVATPAKTVKKINTQKTQNVSNQMPRQTVNTMNSTTRNSSVAARPATASRTVGVAGTPGTPQQTNTRSTQAGARSTQAGMRDTQTEARSPQSGAAANRTINTVRTINTAGRTPSTGSERGSSPNNK